MVSEKKATKKCQFYGIMDSHPLCRRPSTYRLFDDGDFLGEVCDEHERIMRQQHPSITSTPKRKATSL